MRALAEDGWDVTATWVVERERDQAESEFGDSLRLAKADVTDPDSVREAVASVEGLRAVVHLAGGYAGGRKTHETPPEDFDRMVALNLRSAFLLAREAMPRLVGGGGAFVGVSARAAVRPFSGASGYIASKAGLLALVQALDAEYREEGVRCNAVLPSVIDTPANREGQPDADHSKWVAPEAIAGVIRFLVSDESAPVSGAAVPVYGRA